MAIDHDSPFKELRLKNRRIMGGGGPEAEDEEESAAEALVVAAAAAAHDDEQEDEERWPRWLRPLLSARFFAQCKSHADSHRSRECNMFCLDCSAADAADAAASDAALCSLCLSHNHHGHHTIQIRRSSYHDVIRVSDIQRFMDIGGVQTYVINSARVVFLNERPQHKPGKAAASSTVACEVCSRSLLDNFRFCSLGCKLTSSSSSIPIPIPNKRPRHSDDGSSSRSRNAAAAAHSFSPSTPPPPPTNRRKGIPHRAPFGSLIV